MRILLLTVVALVLVGCSSTRRVELKAHRGVYESLGLEESRHDNFDLYKEAASWLNTRHSEGGLTRRGIDCSGLVYMIYKNVYGKTLERSSSNMYKKNCHRIGKSRLKEGDLVFFNTSGNWFAINHVGIYLKDNKFIHTSISKGVMVNSLDEPYYHKTWVCGGRVK
jgi:cell wall-associated NlpC family hydrolase